jgi:hypothetical protein
MCNDSITITTQAKGSHRRYSLTSDTLKIEVVSRRGESISSSNVQLSQLSEKFSVESTGSYLTTPVLFAALSMLPVVVLVPELFPSSRIDTVYLSLGFGVWFLCWVAFGACRDVCFHIHVPNCRETLELVGRTGQQEQLQSFVRRVVEQIRVLKSDDAMANP